MNGNYPIGADKDKSAPFNYKEQLDKWVSVYVSITVSKPVMVPVDDYTFKGYDENNDEIIDYSNCDLKKAFKRSGETIETLSTYEWNVDDFEIVLNE